jgi:hypothetical protein
VIRPSLILLGVIIGLALGVFYGWVISPVSYTDTAPAALRSDYKDQYLILIATSYLADGDLSRAQARLAELGLADPAGAVTALAQRLAAEGKDTSAPSALAAALGVGVAPVTLVPTATTAPPETPTLPPTVTPFPSSTPFPTLTPTATPVYDYVLLSRETYCNDVERLPLIIVDVVGENSQPLAGVRVSVRWAEGEDGFVTGLKPEISSGYGDFLMETGVAYSVQIGNRTPPVAGIVAPTCQVDTDEPYPGAVRLVFQRK